MQKKSLILGLVVFLLAAPSAFAGANNLVGAWEVAIAGEGAPLFLYTFGADGTVQAGTTSITGGGFGVWERDGGRDYDAKVVGYLIGPNGQAFATTTAVLEIELDQSGDTADVTYEIEISTLDGILLDSLQAVGVGTRITLD